MSGITIAAQQDVQFCNKDSDCVFVGTGCASGAVNKRFKIKAEKFVKSMDRDMESCDDGDKTTIPTAYCKPQEIECRNRVDQKNGKKCYADKGVCTPKY